MDYNANMAEIRWRKYMVYLSAEDAKKFETVYARARKKARGRTNFSEVIRGLMGYPPEPDQDELVDDSDRAYLGGKASQLPDTAEATGTDGKRDDAGRARNPRSRYEPPAGNKGGQRQ